MNTHGHINGLMQGRRNFIASTLGIHISCTNYVWLSQLSMVVYAIFFYFYLFILRLWGRVGWMFADHRDGLSSSSFCLILDSSVRLSVGIQSAGDLMSETLMCSNPAFGRGRQFVPFDSNIACLCQSIKINNNNHVYRQSQLQMPNGCGVEWAECSLIIGMGCRVQIFAWS